MKPLISQASFFDTESSILGLTYLINYDDLETWYDTQLTYPPTLAYAVGSTLAKIHRGTLDQVSAKTFLSRNDRPSTRRSREHPDFIQSLGQVTPETFGEVTEDGLKFYELLQRYASLEQAIAQLTPLYTPCCLIHNDLRFANLLVHHQWQSQAREHPEEDAAPVRVIDWEKWRWGDPTFDLGRLVAEYLKRWLRSLMASQDVPIEQALRLATTPLEQVQPSIRQLVRGYWHQFPEVTQRFPDFLARVMRFAGWGLIESLRAHVYYYDFPGNVGICQLQVAKSLLCAPDASMPVVFGEDELRLSDTPAIPPLPAPPLPAIEE
ncbi:phosphotransferase family protein [Vacuolonema iberomarrocanum]|uniref:phosphotransferase family protein n=1 Tax=Vacuolonema iberomarrocanum TaxID=3454632 RepID=UPI0019D9B018|nr:aminoglycoside phosphotransferase family protein [filamentous cyanobacterium LEGE 07170]